MGRAVRGVRRRRPAEDSSRWTRSRRCPTRPRSPASNDLKTYLAEDRIDQVAFSVLKHLATYATGRSLTYNELEFLKQDGLKLKADGYRMQDMIRFVVNSKLFLEKVVQSQHATILGDTHEHARIQLDRRAFLKGLGGVALALPVLDAMGAEVTEQIPRRFCALYTANGMSLPKTEHGIDEWSWFPTAERDGEFVFGKSTEPLAPVPQAAQLHGRAVPPERPQGRPAHLLRHVAHRRPAAQSEAGHVQLGRPRSGRRAAHQAVLPAAVAGAVDRRRHRLPLADGHDLLQPGRRPIPAENNPRRVFDRLFRGDRASLQPQREKLQRRIKLVDAVAGECAGRSIKQLGKSDRERMDQYLTSLNEVESRLIASEKWIDIPLKKQDYSHLNLDATSEGEPAEYYRNMFDLIALAFDADITRSVAFMLNREDGMGISDTFPLKLGLVEDAPQSLARRRQGRAAGSSPSTTCS